MENAETVKIEALSSNIHIEENGVRRKLEIGEVADIDANLAAMFTEGNECRFLDKGRKSGKSEMVTQAKTKDGKPATNKSQLPGGDE